MAAHYSFEQNTKKAEHIEVGDRFGVGEQVVIVHFITKEMLNNEDVEVTITARRVGASPSDLMKLVCLGHTPITVFKSSVTYDTTRGYPPIYSSIPSHGVRYRKSKVEEDLDVLEERMNIMYVMHQQLVEENEEFRRRFGEPRA